MAGGRATLGGLGSVRSSADVLLGLCSAAVSMGSVIPAATCCAGGGVWSGAGGTGSSAAAMLSVSTLVKSAMDIAIAWQRTRTLSGGREVTSAGQACGARTAHRLPAVRRRHRPA